MTSFRKRAAAIDSAHIAAEDASVDWPALETLVHVDPAGRGLASYRVGPSPLDAGQLRAAALHLARGATSVGIVTGFCVVTADGATAETDGPPGALFLARALATLGIDVTLITDRYALPLLACGCELWKIDRDCLVEIPLETPGPSSDSRPARPTGSASGKPMADRWVDEFLATARGRSLTHLIAIERVGPSHTPESIAAQPGGDAAARNWFAAAVPAEDRDVCHNMRGESIDAWTAGAERLFAAIAERGLPITTIGICDGGNEIGMGRFDWKRLVDALASEAAERIVCRVCTDVTIIAGVSNWGAYALALAVARLCGARELGRDWNASGQRHLIEEIVRRTTAVDGLTRRHEPTVDGLPLDVYLRPLDAMRELLGYEK